MSWRVVFLLFPLAKELLKKNQGALILCIVMSVLGVVGYADVTEKHHKALLNMEKNSGKIQILESKNENLIDVLKKIDQSIVDLTTVVDKVDKRVWQIATHGKK